MLRSVVFFVVATSVAAGDEDSNSLLQGYKQILSEESSVRVGHDHDDDDGCDSPGKHDDHCHGDAKAQFICKVKCPAFKVMMKNDMLDTDDAKALTPAKLIPALKLLGAGPEAQKIFNKTLMFHLAKLGKESLDISGPMTFPAANSEPDETTQGFWMEQAFSTGITDRNTVRQFDSSRFNKIFGCEDGMEATPVGLHNMNIASIKTQHDTAVSEGLDQKGFGTASPLLQYAGLFDLFGIGEGKLMLRSELKELLRDGTIPERSRRTFEVPGGDESGPPPTAMVMQALGMELKYQTTTPEWAEAIQSMMSGMEPNFNKVYEALGYCHSIPPNLLAPGHKGLEVPDRTR